MVFLVILTCSLRVVKLETLVKLSKGFFFIGFLCNSAMFLACGETGDTGEAEQGLLFHWFSFYFLYPGLCDLAYGIWDQGSRT